VKRAAGRAFYRFGGDLLSHVLGRSTIGAAALNGRVRDGIGCFARGCCHQTGKTHGAATAALARLVASRTNTRPGLVR